MENYWFLEVKIDRLDCGKFEMILYYFIAINYVILVLIA